uniref:Secreted protein n=1 Tax=Oryza sativa subsp. japonica TaxID=39947 RepID=Q6Z9U2_ORYSJ|nr:hypothetical protein [Oryza sativa Japonica Group]
MMTGLGMVAAAVAATTVFNAAATAAPPPAWRSLSTAFDADGDDDAAPLDGDRAGALVTIRRAAPPVTRPKREPGSSAFTRE